MKNMDVLVVRILPFVLYMLMGIDIVCCLNGIDITEYYYIHSNSFLYAFSLFIISKSNSKYHCKYNRWMINILIFIPLFNFFDSKFEVFENVYAYIYTVIGIYSVGTIATAYLAVRHFVQVRKRKNNGK